MKVLLISPNREAFVHRVPPIGMLHLASILIQKGHNVRVLDLMFSSDLKKDIAEEIEEFVPEIVGISLRNLDTLLCKNIDFVPEIKMCVETIRSKTSAKIIMGGAGFSIFPHELMKYLKADFGIIGEAENSLPLLIDNLVKKLDVKKIPGLIYRNEDILVANLPEFIEDLDSIPFQAIELIDYKKYARKRGNFGVFTRRSCPHECVFCPERTVHGPRVRLRSAEKVVDEIEYIIKKTGINYFDFADTLFNAPREHAVSVCREIVKRKVKFKFEVELNPTGQDEESVKLLKQAGCIGVDLTADAGSQKMLKNLNKGFTLEMVYNVAGLYAKHKIPYTVAFMLGGPGEDLTTVEETIQFAESLSRVAAVFFAVGIRIFKGTEMEKFAYEKGIAKSSDELLKLTFFVDENFDECCAKRLLRACRENLNFYIADSFYHPNMRFYHKIGEVFNIRPVWKFGAFPKIIERIKRFGKDDLYWDKESNSFKFLN